MVKRKELKKTIEDKRIWSNNIWQINYGSVKSFKKEKSNHLFRIVAEKLPIESLSKVKEYLISKDIPRQGIYIAHDSMGYSRYVGLGGIFYRLKTRYQAHPLEIQYYSFYTIPDKVHQRELETLLIRIASPLLEFNSQKKRTTIEVGSVRDYSVGTLFLERKMKKKRVKKIKRNKNY